MLNGVVVLADSKFLTTTMLSYLATMFRIYIFLFYFINFVENASILNGKGGPYKTILTSVRRCPKQKTLEKDPSCVLHLETYNDTRGVPMLRGNFTIMKDTSQWKGKAKQFLWVNGKWKSNVVMHSTGCQGIFITILVTMIKADYDVKRCRIPLGNYTIQGLDVNKVEHLWAPNLIYGKELWRIEVSSPAGMVDCWEVYDVVEPA